MVVERIFVHRDKTQSTRFNTDVHTLASIRPAIPFHEDLA